MSEYTNPVCSEFYYNSVYNNSPISDMNSLNCMYRHEKSKKIFRYIRLSDILRLSLPFASVF